MPQNEPSKHSLAANSVFMRVQRPKSVKTKSEGKGAPWVAKAKLQATHTRHGGNAGLKVFHPIAADPGDPGPVVGMSKT